ncbi:MAG: antitoxin family protein [Chloroflexota bacterium]|nr:antitoxin family protein [Chloroflexota bacterium]MDE2687515.1 antitoxin family protein [Chloroflexota bacterium]
MLKKVRARYSEGSLTPLTPLDLSEGEIVSLTVEVPTAPTNVGSKRAKEERPEEFEATDGEWSEERALEEIRRAMRSPKISPREMSERTRKRRKKMKSKITTEMILRARDADRR